MPRHNMLINPKAGQIILEQAQWDDLMRLRNIRRLYHDYPAASVSMLVREAVDLLLRLNYKEMYGGGSE